MSLLRSSCKSSCKIYMIGGVVASVSAPAPKSTTISSWGAGGQCIQYPTHVTPGCYCYCCCCCLLWSDNATLHYYYRKFSVWLRLEHLLLYTYLQTSLPHHHMWTSHPGPRFRAPALFLCSWCTTTTPSDETRAAKIEDSSSSYHTHHNAHTAFLFSSYKPHRVHTAV